MSESTVHDRSGFQPTDGWLVGIVLAVVTFWLFAQTLLNVIPEIQSSLGMSEGIANLAVTITAIFAGVFIVVFGGLGDRHGQTLIFRIGIGLNILGSLLLIAAPVKVGMLTAAFMLGGRLIQGLSTACIMPSALALINDFYREEAYRQRAVSFFSVGTFGGLGVASLAGGIVASLFGWRSIFVASILVSLAALYLTRKTPVTPGPKEERQTGFDWTGLLTFLVAILGLNVYIAQGGNLGWLSPAGLGVLAVTLIAFVVFIITDLQRGKTAFVNLAMFGNLRFTGPVLANFLMNATAAILITTLSLMQRGAGWSSFQASLLTIGHLMAVLAAIRVGEKLLQKLGPKKPMLWGGLCDLLGVALAACTFLPQSIYMVLAFIGLALFGLGQGLFATPAIDAAITSVPEEDVGVASGILKMGSTLGQAIGVALSTAFVAMGATRSAQQIADWGIFGGWEAAAGPARYGAMLGAGLLVVIALIMVAAIIFTVPGARQRRADA